MDTTPAGSRMGLPFLLGPLARATRRTFLKTAALGLGGLMASGRAGASSGGDSPAPARPAEPGYGDITEAKLMKAMERIVGFCHLSREAGDQLWGRQVGTKYDLMTADYMKERFEAAALDKIWREELPIRAPQWTPTHVELRLLGVNGEGDRVFTTAMSSVDAEVQTPPEGIEAEIVNIGYGTPGELEKANLDGKIALVQRDASYSLFASFFKDTQTTAFIRNHQAVGGVFTVNRLLPSNMRVASWNGPRARTFPHVNLGAQDAAELAKAIEQAPREKPARVRLTVRGKIEEDLKTWNTYGLLRAPKSSEYVVLIAHTDAWFEGATDNATGLAALAALADHFAARPSNTLKRNLLFVATAGHHNGPAAGTFHMVEHNQDILSDTVLLINVEHMASVAPPISGAALGKPFRQTPHLLFDPRNLAFIRKAFRRAAREQGSPMHPRVLSRYVGDMGPFQFVKPRPLPSVSYMQPAYWYHTDEDTIDKISPRGLANATRTLAAVVDMINHASTDEILG